MHNPFRKQRSYSYEDAVGAFMKELRWLRDHMEKHDVKEHDERRVGEMDAVLWAWEDGDWDDPEAQWDVVWSLVKSYGLDWWC